MAGLATHLSAGLLGAIIIHFLFYKSKPKLKLWYGLAFIIANILPDLVDFGVLAIKTWNFNPSEIMKNPLFDTLAVFGHTFSNWSIMALVILAIFLFLYEIEKIEKKTLIMVITFIALILLGIFIHLRLDILIIEGSYWI